MTLRKPWFWSSSLALVAVGGLLLQAGCGNGSFCDALAAPAVLPPAEVYQPVTTPQGVATTDPPIPSGGTPTSVALAAGATLPTGITVGPDGTFTISATTAAGVYNIGVQFCDAAGCATAVAQITVIAQQPLGLAYTSATFTVGQAVSQSPNPTGQISGASDAYALTAGTLPAGLALDPASGVISGTVTTAGVSAFTVTLTETAPTGGVRTAPAAVTDTVNAVFLVAYVAPEYYTVNSPVTTPLDPTVTGATPGLATTFSASVGTLPPGLGLDPLGGLTGTPTTAGVFTPAIAALNGTQTATAAPQCIVLPAGDLSLSYPTPETFPQGVPIPAQNPSPGNAAPGVPLTYSAPGLPSWLNLAAGTGVLTGTPPTLGTFPFTVTVSDGHRTALANLTYIVTAPGTLGLSYLTPVTFTAGQAITAQAAAPVNDLPTLGLAYTANGLPPWLILDPASGTITGTPPATAVNYTTGYPFTVTLQNGPSLAASTNVLYFVLDPPPDVSYAPPAVQESPTGSTTITPILNPGSGPVGGATFGPTQPGDNPPVQWVTVNADGSLTVLNTIPSAGSPYTFHVRVYNDTGLQVQTPDPVVVLTVQ